MSVPSTTIAFSAHRPNMPIGWLEHVPARPSTWNDQSAAIVASPARQSPVSEYIGTCIFPGLGGAGVSPSKITRPLAEAPRPTTIDNDSSPPLVTVTLVV